MQPSKNDWGDKYQIYIALSLKRHRRTVLELPKAAIHDYVNLFIKDFNKEVVHTFC